MVELIIEVPDELGERIKSFPSVNWMDVERKAIESKLSELELKKSADMRRILVEVISSLNLEGRLKRAGTGSLNPWGWFE